MALFDILRKKREELPLPPPPLPPPLKGDIAPIRAPAPEEFSEAPELDYDVPDLSLPELPPPAMEKEGPSFETRTVFDKTVRAESPVEAPEIIRPSPRQSFVAVEDFKRIVNDTNIIRAKLMEAENFVKRLNELKNDEERALERWRGHIEDVEKKLSYVDQLIEKAQR